MHILVTGGTGVVGRSTVTALLQHGHVVHLLSRHAERDARQWSQGVHPIVGNVTNAVSIAGAADGCEVVLHLTAIVAEHGNQTFDRVNVDGTRHVVQEAERAGVRRFVYVSSLGADSGKSAYHQSKRKAEAIARQFKGTWVVLRPGNVYGPGDEQISLLLRMVRTLPVLPIVGDGSQRFQPLWHEDLAEALASAVEREDLASAELDLAGPEVTTQNDLVQRLSRLTGRSAPQVAIPQMIATLGLRIAHVAGFDPPVSESQMTMLSEGNLPAPGRENGLLSLLPAEPTPLDRGLRMLADAQKEQLPDDGVGPLRRTRFRVDISDAAMTPERLMDHVRAHFGTLMASFIDTKAEPNAATDLHEGATLTLSLPFRGHIQVRVAESEPRVITLLTLAGHPLSGAVRLLSEARGGALRFEIQSFDRAATVVDLLMMRALGERLQEAAWREMAENVVRASGGAAPAGVQRETENLDDAQAEHIEDWLRDLVQEQQREEAGI